MKGVVSRGALIDAIQDVGLPPCEWLGGCEHRRRCATERMACSSYRAYLTGPAGGNRGRPTTREPSREEYMRAFHEQSCQGVVWSFRKRKGRSDAEWGWFPCSKRVKWGLGEPEIEFACADGRCVQPEEDAA